MKITDKTLEAFREWLPKYVFQSAKDLMGMFDLDDFNEFIPSLKYGVYVDFFDSVEIDIDDIFKGELFELYTINQDDRNYRREAQIAAIEKADSLFNNKKEQL